MFLIIDIIFLFVLVFVRWWNETGLAKELNFARNQPIQRYLGSLLCLPDPCYSEQRFQLAKSLSLIYLIDDLFDVLGTLDELTLFTEAVNRLGNSINRFY